LKDSSIIIDGSDLPVHQMITLPKTNSKFVHISFWFNIANSSLLNSVKFGLRKSGTNVIRNATMLVDRDRMYSILKNQNNGITFFESSLDLVKYTSCF